MKLISEETLARAYYHIKPFMSRRLQLYIRGAVARQKRIRHSSTWPIDPAAGEPPAGFTGWPNGKRFAVVLTHDVDTARGVVRCESLMALERDLGFRSSFNFVAHDYHLPAELRLRLVEEGFEVGLHGLEHNRKLYESASTFAEHAKQINNYLKEWGAVGFRSPCVYHNFDWLHALDIVYEASAFDTDPFEPQSDALGTIFPVAQRKVPGREYVVLPYTLPQDFTMFLLFREKDISIWKQKLRWIADHGGMALLISHPDYMSFDGPPNFDEYHPDLYRDLLRHIKSEYQGEYWHALPQELASFWNRNVSGVTMGEPAEARQAAAPMGLDPHEIATTVYVPGTVGRLGDHVPMGMALDDHIPGGVGLGDHSPEGVGPLGTPAPGGGQMGDPAARIAKGPDYHE
jgi:peptidoglycan/xylan/chitin deacetylase (PgdA/CDA1 family)